MNLFAFDRSFAPSEPMTPSKQVLANQPYVLSNAPLKKSPRQSRLQRRLAWWLIPFMFFVCISSVLLWGGYLLIADDPLPSNVDGAVALQGSVLGQEARIAGAVQLIQQGTVSRILVSVPKETYWGQPVAPIAHDHLVKLYGQNVVDHVEFCETFDVDSTEEEARALLECINERSWHTVAVVTSDYHTRRAGMIWRKVLKRQQSSVDLRLHAVPDSEFHASGWWRERRSAKTWLFELTKLLWTLGGGN